MTAGPSDASPHVSRDVPEATSARAQFDPAPEETKRESVACCEGMCISTNIKDREGYDTSNLGHLNHIQWLTLLQ